MAVSYRIYGVPARAIGGSQVEGSSKRNFATRVGEWMVVVVEGGWVGGWRLGTLFFFPLGGACQGRKATHRENHEKEKLVCVKRVARKRLSTLWCMWITNTRNLILVRFSVLVTFRLGAKRCAP